ncbi:MAG: 50S ribosomal protein L25, partial [Betaproteobacteria bacterium]
MKVVATTRKEQGSSASRRLRRSQQVPGIIYGGTDKPTPIAL